MRPRRGQGAESQDPLLWGWGTLVGILLGIRHGRWDASQRRASRRVPKGGAEGPRRERGDLSVTPPLPGRG